MISRGAAGLCWHDTNHLPHVHLARRLRRGPRPEPREPARHRRSRPPPLASRRADQRGRRPRARRAHATPRRLRHGPQHVRADSRLVGRGLARMVGRGAAVPRPGVRPHPLSRTTRSRWRAERRSTSSPRGSSRAFERAQAAAGDLGVDIAGGAATVRQALAAGAIDELMLDIVPVVLGSGERLFDGVAGPGPRAGGGDPLSARDARPLPRRPLTPTRLRTWRGEGPTRLGRNHRYAEVSSQRGPGFTEPLDPVRRSACFLHTG